MGPAARGGLHLEAAPRPRGSQIHLHRDGHTDTPKGVCPCLSALPTPFRTRRVRHVRDMSALSDAPARSRQPSPAHTILQPQAQLTPATRRPLRATGHTPSSWPAHSAVKSSSTSAGKSEAVGITPTAKIRTSPKRTNRSCARLNAFARLSRFSDPETSRLSHSSRQRCGCTVTIRRRPKRGYRDVSERLSSSGWALYVSTSSRSVSMPKSVNAMTPSSPGRRPRSIHLPDPFRWRRPRARPRLRRALLPREQSSQRGGLC